MCPLCKDHQDKPCDVVEKPDGRLVCTCGRHSWPDSGAFLETCRRESLTIVGRPHIWTQSY